MDIVWVICVNWLCLCLLIVVFIIFFMYCLVWLKKVLYLEGCFVLWCLRFVIIFGFFILKVCCIFKFIVFFVLFFVKL